MSKYIYIKKRTRFQIFSGHMLLLVPEFLIEQLNVQTRFPSIVDMHKFKTGFLFIFDASRIHSNHTEHTVFFFILFMYAEIYTV